jgi:hypothetical protein
MDAAQIFQILAVGLGLLGVLSTAAVITRSTVVTQNNSQLRNAYTDARNSLIDEEKKVARLEGELVQCKERATLLEEMVTRKAAVDELSHEVRTLTGVVRSDYAHLAPRLEMIIQGGIQRGTNSPPDGP